MLASLDFEQAHGAAFPAGDAMAQTIASSQYSFRTPRLSVYESREMVSAIERMTSANAPDWRKLKAEVHIIQ